jgi:hypothetical protein
MAKRRKLGIKQHIPESSVEPLFQVVEYALGDSYWHIKIKDAIVGDEPEFRFYLPKNRENWPDAQRVANAGAGELNEARGLISLSRYEDGIPVFSAQYASDGRQVYCLWSSDECVPSVRNNWAAAELGHKGGQSKSPEKTIASRENGKRGGRPSRINSSVFD